MKLLKHTALSVAVVFALSACGNSGLLGAYPEGVNPGQGGQGSNTGGNGGLPPTNKPSPSNPNNSSYSVKKPSAKRQQEIDVVVDNVNKLRKSKDLKPLKVNPSLSAYAQRRAEEIVKKFSHTRPDGKGALSFVHGGWAGENIAAGSSTGNATFNQWKESPGHYANMVNSGFTQIGMGSYCEQGSEYGCYWVQIFSNDGGYTDYSFASEQSSSSRTASARTLVLPELIAGNASLSEITRFMLNHAEVASDGTLKLDQADEYFRASSYRGKDAGMNAYRRGEVTHPAFSSVKVYRGDKASVVLRDPDAAGWRYQTFGRVVDADNHPLGYVTIGVPTPSQDLTNIKAYYSGIGMGHYQGSDVVSDMKAVVHLTPFRQDMELNLENSKISEGNLDRNQYVPLRRDSRFDVRDNLVWDKKDQKFRGNGTEAKLFGPKAAEIGGLFRKTVDGKTYEGAFGGQKQP